MSGMLWRVLFAVIAVVAFWQLLPPVSRLIGFEVSGDFLAVVRIVVGLLAVLYIVRGAPPSWTRT